MIVSSSKVVNSSYMHMCVWVGGGGTGDSSTFGPIWGLNMHEYAVMSVIQGSDYDNDGSCFVKVLNFLRV